MASQLFCNKVDRLSRHITIIEDDIEQLSNQNLNLGLNKENVGLIIKGETLCTQGLVSIMKYLGNIKSKENRLWLDF